MQTVSSLRLAYLSVIITGVPTWQETYRLARNAKHSLLLCGYLLMFVVAIP